MELVCKKKYIQTALSKLNVKKLERIREGWGQNVSMWKQLLAAGRIG